MNEIEARFECAHSPNSVCLMCVMCGVRRVYMYFAKHGIEHFD